MPISDKLSAGPNIDFLLCKLMKKATTYAKHRSLALLYALAWSIALTAHSPAQEPLNTPTPADTLPPSATALLPTDQDSDLPPHAVARWGEFGKQSENGIYRIQYSPDGKYLATRNNNNTVAIFDLTSQNQEQVCEIDGHEEWVQTIDFSIDSQYFMTAAGANEKVKIWNTHTGKLESEIDTDGSAAFFDPAGDAINVLGETHVETYSWPGVQMTGQKKWRRNNETRSLVSRDGRYVVAYRPLNRQVFQTLLIDVESRSNVQLSGPTGTPKCVKISADNVWVVASYNRDPKIRLWDLRDPSQRRYELRKHDETVQSVSFSPDGRFLVSSSWDEKVIVWDLLTRQPIGEFLGHSEHVNATASAPLDYGFASGASGTTDCSTILWDMKELLFKPEHKPDPNSKLTREQEFDSIWRLLGTSSLKTSMTATSRFAQSGDLYLDLLENRIQPVISNQSSGTIDERIKLLEHPEFKVRTQATEDLIKLKGLAEAKLRRVLKDNISPEIRYRISLILRRKEPRPKSNVVETRRWFRTILSLEEINSVRSQTILKSIADGHRDVYVSEHAKKSFDRNIQRNNRVEAAETN